MEKLRQALGSPISHLAYTPDTPAKQPRPCSHTGEGEALLTYRGG